MKRWTRTDRILFSSYKYSFAKKVRRLLFCLFPDCIDRDGWLLVVTNSY